MALCGQQLTGVSTDFCYITLSRLAGHVFEILFFNKILKTIQQGNFFPYPIVGLSVFLHQSITLADCSNAPTSHRVTSKWLRQLFIVSPPLFLQPYYNYIFRAQGHSHCSGCGVHSRSPPPSLLSLPSFGKAWMPMLSRNCPRPKELLHPRSLPAHIQLLPADVGAKAQPLSRNQLARDLSSAHSLLYEFSRTAAINYQKPDSLKQQEFISSRLWKPETQN